MKPVRPALLPQLRLEGDYEVDVHEYELLTLDPQSMGLGRAFYQAAIRFVPADQRYPAHPVCSIPKEFPSKGKNASERARLSAEPIRKALREFHRRSGVRFEIAFTIREREAGRPVNTDRLRTAILNAVK